MELEIAVVAVSKSRFLGHTIQEGETVNSLTAQGPEATAELIREFFSSDKYDTCTIVPNQGQESMFKRFSFVRDQGRFKILFENIPLVIL